MKANTIIDIENDRVKGNRRVAFQEKPELYLIKRSKIKSIKN